MPRPKSDLDVWQRLRPDLLGLAYRMLGDAARAEDLVQDSWLKWSERKSQADDARAYLFALVSRLCLNELRSARARKEESRSDRLPEPIDLRTLGLEHGADTSMAFLVLLQRLTPPERAALVLHEVFDFEHAELGALLGKTPAACRKLLERAKRHLASAQRALDTTPAEHAEFIRAFTRASRDGDLSQITDLLAPKVAIITDGGPRGVRFRGVGNLRVPLVGKTAVARFVGATTRRNASGLETQVRTINGQPALVLLRKPSGTPFAVVLLEIARGRVRRIYFCADPARLGHLALPQR